MSNNEATSRFGIRIDFEKSQGSYIHDKSTNRKYLDLFGMYSSLPLGYNNSAFGNEFDEEIKRISQLKIVNCEILSDEYDSFIKSFREFASMGGEYDNFHFTCTGALAVEAAIKTAMWYSGATPGGQIISLRNSFHGINSYGNILTTRFSGVSARLGDLPGENLWQQCDTVSDIINLVKEGNPHTKGVIIEPIQATYGDNHLDIGDLKELRDVCTEYDVPLIFDEVQTGFCASGQVWYSQKIEISPDIIIFGKKSQVSGILVKNSHAKIFEDKKRLCVTFDGDLIDMVRCKYIISAVVEKNLLKNVEEIGSLFLNSLHKLDGIKNPRGVGFLIAFDFETAQKRDDFAKAAFQNGILCNPTGEKSIRLRPNLSFTKKDAANAIEAIRRSL